MKKSTSILVSLLALTSSLPIQVQAEPTFSNQSMAIAPRAWPDHSAKLRKKEEESQKKMLSALGIIAGIALIYHVLNDDEDETPMDTPSAKQLDTRTQSPSWQPYLTVDVDERNESRAIKVGFTTDF